ncbi:putative two-component sensor [hydrocarbon metagenome]|uniref:Putative two-component sensor n=1 Tax=hydrocarbon metagenome TaxID=938273 RepID=A0A0W8E5P0_9ZZZZ
MKNLIEVIGVKADNCINCHQCIAVCPVKICMDGSGDVVKFNNQLCIGCGRCIEACIKSHGGIVEKSARFPIDDTDRLCKDLMEKDIIALVAPSAQSNFELGQLISALRLLGIKAVYDVSLGAEITIALYHQTISAGKTRLPIIAQPCPAVVTYIELHHPALIPHLAPIGSPVHNTAVYARSLHPDCEVAFISPCLAKRREFQDSQMIQYNVIYKSLVKVFQEKNIDIEILDQGQFDNYVAAGIATNFSTPGGLKESYIYKYPDTPSSSITRIEGPIIYEKYLRDLEEAVVNGCPDRPVLIDILSCEKGCNMGAGCINQNKSMDKIERSIAQRSEQAVKNEEAGRVLQEFLEQVVDHDSFNYHCYKDLSSLNTLKHPNGDELENIYTKMHKTEEKDFRNCAACGYNSCLDMAVAVYNGLNKYKNCHVYQEKELRIEQEILNHMLRELADLNKKLQAEFNERKQQEQLLIQNSKLAAMGEMIGMIAHQWRQPLSSISTIAGNLQVYIDLDMYEKEQFAIMLSEINNHTQYLSDTINDFRHFFKPDNPRDKVTLDNVIGQTLGIIGKSLEYKNISLFRDYSFNNPILTYPNELMQVFLNIIKNASDAFIDNDIINPGITIRGYETEQYHVVEIEDNAGGIPADVINLIFDPYFSTKGPSVGTGLGLYMSKLIIEEHCGGKLTTWNTPGGACFSVKLPVL